MNEEQIKLIVSMQLRQVNQQLNQLRHDVNNAFRDIGNSREVDRSTDRMERSFRNLNRNSSEEIRQMYKTIRRYLGDMEHDVDITTREIRYELQNMLNNIFNGNGGNINLSGLTRALRDAMNNAFGGSSGNNIGDQLFGRGLTEFTRSLGGIGSLINILGISETIRAIDRMNAGMSQTSRDIASMATQSKNMVMNLPDGTKLVEPIQALNINMINLEKILAMLIKQFGTMMEMLQRISSIQMGTGLMNYGKYVSTVITQTGKLKEDLEKVNEAANKLTIAKASGNNTEMVNASKELYGSMQEAVNQMIIAQNTLNNLKSMAGMGIFKDIDTGSLGVVSNQLIVIFEELERAINRAKELDINIDANIDLSQIQNAETILNGFSTKYEDIKRILADGTNFEFDIDYTDIDQMLNEIDKEYLKIIEKINGEPIKPKVDSENAKREIITLKDLMNVFGGKEMFHEIDMDMPRNIFDNMTADAQEVKTIIDQMYAQFNEGVDFGGLEGVKEQIDRIKLAFEAAANARQHLNELDQNGLGLSDEAQEWTSRLMNAQETLVNSLRQLDHEFGQYRLVDWTMFTRDARQAVENAANNVRERLTDAMQGFSNTAGTILYRIGAYFTIPPERMDQIVAQLREKFSSFWDSVKSKGREAFDAIAQSDIAQKIKPYFDKAVDVVKTAASKMKDALDKVWGSRFGAFINNNLSLMTRGFKGVINKIKDLASKFKDNMKKIKDRTKEAADKVNESTNKMGNGIKSLISRFIGLAAILGSLKALWNLGKEAMMLEGQLQNLYITLGTYTDKQTNQLKYYGDVFQEWANNVASAYGISASAAIKYGNTFSMILGRSIPKNNLLTSTTELLQQASLIASRTGRTVDDVMNRIRSGLLGGSEAIEDLGIYIRENTLKSLLNSKDFENMYGQQIAQGIGQTVQQLSKNYANLDDDAKNTLRYYAIMYQSIQRFGKATEDSFNTTTGVLLKFQAQVENTKLALGRMMVPIMTVVLPLLTSALKMVEIIADRIGQVFTKIAQLMGYEVTDYTANVNVDYDSNIADQAKEDTEALKETRTQLAGYNIVACLYIAKCWKINL